MFLYEICVFDRFIFEIQMMSARVRDKLSTNQIKKNAEESFREGTFNQR